MTDLPKPKPTMPLDEFRELYRQDDNEWWRLQSGDMQNLFEAAVDRLDEVETVVAEMREHIVPGTPSWYYLHKLELATKGVWGDGDADVR